MLALRARPSCISRSRYLLLTQTYCETFGDNEKALAKVDEAIARFPNDAGLVFTKGQVLRKMDRGDDAQELFEKALTLRELMAYSVMTDEELFEWKIFYSLAGIYEHKKDYDRAIEYVDMALANKPSSLVLQRSKAGFSRKSRPVLRCRPRVPSYGRDRPRTRSHRIGQLLAARHRYAQALAIVENEIDPG